jgi:hypothetical protein
VRLPKTETDPEFETQPVPAAEDLFPTFLAVKQVWDWWFKQEQAYQAKRAEAKAA